MKNVDYNNIIEQITKRNRISRLIVLIIGAFLVALIYNAFIVANNIVYGGLGGVAIIATNLTGVDTILFINVVTALLILLSIFIIGVKKTSYTIIGFLAYTIMINLTSPIAHYFELHFDSFLLTILFYSFFTGLGCGLIYKCGFNTGGMDSVVVMLQKYIPFQSTYLSNIINGMIILVGALNFGIVKSIYAVVYLKFSNFICEKVIVGASTSKLCFIKSHNLKEVKKYLENELEVGYTLIESTNGIGILKKNIIMCVVPSDRYHDLKHELIRIDKKSELLSHDCFTVVGGRRNLLINVNN